MAKKSQNYSFKYKKHRRVLSKSAKEHLNDIDFRRRELRQADYKSEFIKWYNELHRRQALQPSERISGQISMLNSVLWTIMDKEEYAELVARVIDDSDII